MKAHLRQIGLALGMLAIVGLIYVLQAQAPAKGQAQAPRPPVHPLTLKHKVTSEQMNKWEKELSNWGRWGKDDMKGTLNLITPEKTLAALRLIKEGISVSMHKFPEILPPGERNADTGRFAETVHWMTSVEGGARYAPRPGEPRPGSPPGRITGALDAISIALHEGPHLDALCHYAMHDTRNTVPIIFNGFKQNATPEGCLSASIDKMGVGYITRGILVDFPLMMGVPYLEKGLPLFASDLEKWEKFANVKIGPGDALFIRTGRWARKAAEGGMYDHFSHTAGLHVSTAPWLKARDLAIIGADVATDVIPSGVDGWTRPLHDLALPVFGTPFVDNAYTEDVAREAARRKRWEFTLTVQLLQTPNGTATPFMALATF